MSRFQVGETVEFWTPYGTTGMWEKSKVVRIEEAETGEPMVSVQDPREPDEGLGVPNIFLRKFVDREGKKYPPVVYPANEFLLVQVAFPQKWDGDGTEHAIKFVFTLENVWTGAHRPIEAWFRSRATEDSGWDVSASMVWGLDEDDKNQPCSVKCQDPSCGINGFYGDVMRAARSCAGITRILQEGLADGKTHEEALDLCHAKFTYEAYLSMTGAEKAYVDSNNKNSRPESDLDPILARVAEQLGIDPENMKVIDLGGGPKNPNN